ncbi:MAG: hypothetical protein NTV46_13520, partial [Verrucomicrobia bacterium]|nr:hypothetical protein [Verrucomicrobiota bacterium]
MPPGKAITVIPGGILVGTFQYIIMAKTRRKAEAAQEARRPHANVVPLREEYAALARIKAGTGSALVLALVLAQMEYWQGHKDRDRFTAEEVERAMNGGRGPTDCGWFYKSARELCAELFDMTSQSTVDRALDRLHDLGILHRRRNQVRRNDRTHHYRLDLLVLGTMLREQGHGLERWPEVDGILRGRGGEHVTSA